jgi:hypothetical protein
MRLLLAPCGALCYSPYHGSSFVRVPFELLPKNVTMSIITAKCVTAILNSQAQTIMNEFNLYR